MSYRCELCQRVVPPRRSLLRHVTYKGDGNVRQEYAVCNGCKVRMEGGVPPEVLSEVPLRKIETVLVESPPPVVVRPRPYVGGGKRLL